MKTCVLIAHLLLFFSAAISQRIIRDISFNEDQFTANANVRCVAIQNDQKILFFGDCSFYNGKYLPYGGRLLRDGTIDGDFAAPALNGRVDAIAIQPWDQKIIIGGSFTTINGIARRGIARLNTDGSLDITFDPGTGISGPSGGDLRIWSIAIKDAMIPAKRRIIAGGQFQQFNGFNTGTDGGLVQLLENGSRDALYNPKVEQGPVYKIYLDRNNKLLIGGEFWYVGGVFKLRIARLNEDGTLDTGFSSGTGFAGPSASVTAIAVTADDKVLIGGYFQQFNGITRRGLAKLNTDGSPDISFNAGAGFQNGGSVYDYATEVRSILAMADGSAIVAGNFTRYNGMACNNIVMLRNNGTVATDSTFDAGFNEWVMDVKLQDYLPGEKRIITAGFFDSYQAQKQGAVMRLFAPVVLNKYYVKAKAVQQGNKVQVTWATDAVNKAADVFIERSADGSRFDIVCHKRLAEFGTSANGFVYQEPVPAADMMYYRVIIRDKETYQASSVTVLHLNTPVKVSVFPNPFTNKIIVRSNSIKNGACNLELYDINGRLIKSKRCVAGNENIEQVLYLPELPLGSFVLRITDDSGILLWLGKLQRGG